VRQFVDADLPIRTRYRAPVRRAIEWGRLRAAGERQLRLVGRVGVFGRPASVGFFPLDMARLASGKFGTVTVLNSPLATKRMAKGKFSTLTAHPIPSPLTCRS
jgi:hypothetical protein